ERALADVGANDCAGTHAWAGSAAERRRCRDRDQGARHSAKSPVGRADRRGQPGQPEGKSVNRSVLAFAGTAPEQCDDRSSYCDEGSACKHWLLLPIGWDEAEPQTKGADGFRNDE